MAYCARPHLDWLRAFETRLRVSGQFADCDPADGELVGRDCPGPRRLEEFPMCPLTIPDAAQSFHVPVRSVASDRLMMARGLKLHGCPSWSPPIADAAAAKPRKTQVGPPVFAQVAQLVESYVESSSGRGS